MEIVWSINRIGFVTLISAIDLFIRGKCPGGNVRIP